MDEGGEAMGLIGPKGLIGLMGNGRYGGSGAVRVWSISKWTTEVGDRGF
jgi:hypothetical protein